jgi:hypothetical protein
MLIYKLKITDANTHEVVHDGKYFLERDIKTYNLKNAKSTKDMDAVEKQYDKLNDTGQGRYIISKSESDK